MADDETTGWGATISGRWTLSESDFLVYGASYGDGIGRYLLGLDPFAGGYVDSVSQKLESRTAKGAYISHAHEWRDDIRTNIMYGEAHADDDDILLGGTFKNSKYFASNIFYEVTPYLVLGLEYGWGERENVDGSDLDNQRLMFGIQLF